MAAVGWLEDRGPEKAWLSSKEFPPMRMGKSRYPMWLMLVAVPCLLAAITGCVPIVWLPDSSGFVYPVDGKLVHYDRLTGKRRVLVAKLPSQFLLPAVSPDGKRIAVARLGRDRGTGAALIMQIILYDLRGREVSRSPESPWGPLRGSYETSQPVETGVFWPAGPGKLIVQDWETPGRVGIYDPERKRLIVLEGSPLAFGGTPCRPDGKGFLVVRPDGPSVKLALVDWDGKERPIRMRPEAIDSEDKVWVINYPLNGTSAWEGNVAVVNYGTIRIRIDTDKLVGTFESVPKEEAYVGGKEVLQQFAFPKGGVKLRVLQAQKGEGPPEKRERLLHLELLGAKAGKPRLLKELENGCFLFSPSPDGKWLAVRAVAGKVNPHEVLLVSSGGEVREVIDCRHNR